MLLQKRLAKRLTVSPSIKIGKTMLVPSRHRLSMTKSETEWPRIHVAAILLPQPFTIAFNNEATTRARGESQSSVGSQPSLWPRSCPRSGLLLAVTVSCLLDTGASSPVAAAAAAAAAAAVAAAAAAAETSFAMRLLLLLLLLVLLPLPLLRRSMRPARLPPPVVATWQSQISWQAKHLVNLEVQISWQAQHFVNLDAQISWQAQCLVKLDVQSS